MKPLLSRLARVITSSALVLVSTPLLDTMPAHAGSTSASIRGVVKDPNGVVVPGATLELVLAENGQKLVLKTDDKGKFMQPGARPGTWNVTVKKEGFADFAQEIHLSIGDHTPVEITIAPVATTATGVTAGFTIGDAKISKEAGELFQTAQTALAAKDDAAAREALTKFIAIEPGVTVAYFMLAQVERDGGNKPHAIELLKTGLEKEPANVPALIALGELEQEAGDTDGAVTAFRKAADTAPDDSLAWRRLGMALVTKQDFGGATQALENYLRLKPDAPDAAEKKALLEELRKLGAKPAAK